ncbi:MAG: ImmA/IrrE family metallo-endopeptidase [DPANN group archaeon]|nr:ImmA/IrrE family metallo-endopeptidase [DPANN group archaeon]
MVFTMNQKDIEFEINPLRLQYILDLYRLSNDDFIKLLNSGRKKELLNLDRLNSILTKKEKINISVLKNIDNIFKKGLTWYISNRDLPEKKASSIFFRKDTFNSDLNFESKKRIANYEELKLELEILCKQIDFTPKKRLNKYRLSDTPNVVAKEILTIFNEMETQMIEKKYIKKASCDRDYLKNLFRVCEQFNIFIFEFIDRNRKEEKVISFNGMFMLPNMIVLKRQQPYLRREIFTLLHELAHYLLDFEEIDETVETNAFDNLNSVERWCNDFTYHFLIKGYDTELSDLKQASIDNDFYKGEMKNLHDKTYLSEFALFTRLKIESKISSSDYIQIKNEMLKTLAKQKQDETRQFEGKKLLAEEQGKKLFICGPKEIRSKLFEEIVKINYFEGKINENKLREHLKIKSDMSIDKVIY